MAPDISASGAENHPIFGMARVEFGKNRTILLGLSALK